MAESSGNHNSVQSQEIITRAEAKARGLKRYFTGELCKNGHVSERRVSTHQCVECVRVWLQNNPERVRKSRRKWEENNPERTLDYKRNKDRRRSKTEKYRERYRRRLAVAANREKANEQRRRRRADNPEGVREIERRWRKSNPDSHRASDANRRARKRAAAGAHTVADRHDLLKKQSHKCAYCRTSLRKTKKHLDHIIALVRGGANDKRNLQFLCASCNSSKGAKHPIEFAQGRGLLL